MTKKSKKKIYECFELFDHIVVLSKLDDKNSKNPIILDAWIGKAMSFSKAKEEYLGMLSEEEIEKIVKNGLASYNLAHALNFDDNDTVDLNGIDYSIQIVFDELESSFLKRKFEQNPDIISENLHAKFPDLALK